MDYLRPVPPDTHHGQETRNPFEFGRELGDIELVYRTAELAAIEASHPRADLCYLGGWKSPLTVMTVYQQPDEVMMRTVIATREKRRAASE